MEKVVFLADRNSKSWDFAEKIRDYLKKERNVYLQLKEVSINHFRNQEIDMHIPENLRRKEVYFIHDSSKNPQEWWVELLLLKDLLLNSSVEGVTFVLLDMFYSRKDRKEKPHVPISARALARSISYGLKRIITMDLHAAQIQGFYPENVPLDNLYSFPAVVRHLKEKKTIENLEDLVIVSPDAGGVDRARAFAQKLGPQYPLAFIEKRRVNAGEIKEMFLVGNVAEKNALIIDDIIDSGNTLCYSAELLKKNNAKRLYCYCTHGLFTEGAGKLLENFDKILISNTHYSENKGVEVIDVSPLFAEAIYRAEKGLSISQLFE